MRDQNIYPKITIILFSTGVIVYQYGCLLENSAAIAAAFVTKVVFHGVDA